MPGSPEITTEPVAMAGVLLDSITKVAGVGCFLRWPIPLGDIVLERVRKMPSAIKAHLVSLA